MSDNASWYQRKLAQMRQTAPPYSGIPANRAQPQPVTYNPAHVHHIPQPHPQPQVPPKVTVENLYEAMHFFRGGEGERTNPNQCPRCGSNHYFDNVKASKRGPTPAPHCYNCGYNDGMFDQGLPSTWGATGGL
jgi:hypothetical protein